MSWSIAIHAAAASEPVSTDEAKRQCRLEEDDTSAELATYIAGARAAVETWLNRGALITQTLDLTATEQSDVDQLPIYPVQSITSITDADAADASSLFTQALGGKYPSLKFIGTTWPGTITIRAVCGFGIATAVPADIKLACLFLVSALYDNRGELSPNVFDTLDQILVGWRRPAMM